MKKHILSNITVKSYQTEKFSMKIPSFLELDSKIIRIIEMVKQIKMKCLYLSKVI